MVQGASKRNASRTPEGERAHKRMATSSPEEGEVDDSTPLPDPTPLVLRPSLPPKPQLPAKRGPVAFPFKKKADLPKGPSINGDIPKDGNIIYERPEGDDQRGRGGNGRQRGGRGPATHYRDAGMTRGESLLSRIGPPRPENLPEDRYRPSSPPDSRSRSPGSRSPAPQHRLPSRRTPEPAFSPVARDHRADYPRDRDRNGYDRRDFDSYRPRPRDDYGDRYYDRDRGRYDGGLTNESERYYRPNDTYRREDDRAWTRRGDDWRRRDDSRRHKNDRYDRDDYERTRRTDSHRLQTSPPRRSSPSPERNTPRPRSPSPSEPAPSTPPPAPKPVVNDSEPPSSTPPPPASSPPPAPPPDARLMNNSNLPPTHNHVSINLKRPDPPPAPRDRHSPTPLLLHPAKAENKENKGRPPEKKDEGKFRPHRRREVRMRTKKEEMEAFGRVFKGCGSQSDYSVTTKLGEGTFGEVHKAIHKESGDAVALKRILMHNEKEGMPVTALREIKILKALEHPNIIEIRDMFVLNSNSKDPLSVYMVFPYMDHDLAGLLENDRVKLQPSHIKLYMKQLLEGTEYMHQNNILHRDMKAANLLISNSGSLRIADFGLARAYDGLANEAKARKYTNFVVTRWYRPPELLLGARQYGGEIDIWGIGCVLGEMFTRRPILPGNSDLDQLDKIWQLCGTPNQHTWPNHDNLPGCEGIKRFTQYPRKLKQVYESVGPETCDLLDKLLTCNPRERITAASALDHEYFWTDPLPADPKTLPSYEPSHEFDKRGHRAHHQPQHAPMPPPAAPTGPHFDRHPPHHPYNQHNRHHGGGGGPRGRFQQHHNHRGPHGPSMLPHDGNSSLPLRPSASLPPLGPNQYRGPPRHGPGHGPGRDDSWGNRPLGLPQRPPAPQGFPSRNSGRPGPPVNDGPLNYG